MKQYCWYKGKIREIEKGYTGDYIFTEDGKYKGIFPQPENPVFCDEKGWIEFNTKSKLENLKQYYVEIYGGVYLSGDWHETNYAFYDSGDDEIENVIRFRPLDDIL